MSNENKPTGGEYSRTTRGDHSNGKQSRTTIGEQTSGEQSRTASDEKSQIKPEVSIEDAGPCKKKVTVTIAEETIRKQTDEKYENLRKDTILPGFRKGRAPRRLLEKRFGKDVNEQIKLQLIGDASDTALKDNKIDFLREPTIEHEKVELPATGPLKFEFVVEVKPEFELPKLDGIEVKQIKRQVTDEQINNEVEQLRKRYGLWTPKEDGKVEPEDLVIADAVIKTEGDAQDQKLNNVEVFARKNALIGDVPVKDLDSVLASAKIGDVKTIAADVPKTYFKEHLRGKKVDIHVTIKDIKWLKPAELNETLFKILSVENAGQLRERISAELNDRLQQQAKQELADQIHNYLADHTKFDLPTEIVAEQSDIVLRRRYMNLMRMGLAKEQIEQNIEKVRAGSEEEAKKQLKTFFIMDKLAQKLGIETTEEEINGYIAQLAAYQQQRPERLREIMTRDGSLAQFSLEIRDEKCINKLLESAKITEVEPEKAVAKKLPKKTEEKKPEEKKIPKAAPEKKPKKEEKKGEKAHEKTDKKTTKQKAAPKKKTGKEK